MTFLAPAAARRFAAAWSVPDLRARLADALAREAEERRFFLWLPIAAIAGVALNLAALREPPLGPPAAALALAALSAGFLAQGLATKRANTPMLERLRIVTIRGRVEEVDFRETGARFVVAVADADGLDDLPRRVRLTARKAPDFAAGDFVAAKARLLPPPRAVLPGGYDFARDAFFLRIGAVGSALGPARRIAPLAEPSWRERMFDAMDRARNRLALRVTSVIGGDAGAVAAAMVTGKRDFLSQDARDLIREAGIFHLITISGVQMTLVAGIVFVVARRTMALAPRLALRWPIKKIAALIAMAGSLAYDLMTGSRVGAERALIMTLIVLGAAVLDRRALTMRNLALAILAIVAIEPQAVMGVSFQLSFAAVAALVAVMEARLDAREAAREPAVPPSWFGRLAERIGALSFATLCATGATASFMAYHFHDLSPYVLIGNPLTLAAIEFFAVPGALLGAALYPLGLDAPVWLFVGLGVRLVLLAARLIAAAPGSTLHLPAFAPWALPFLSLGVASLVIWRTSILRATAAVYFALGLWGAASGPRYDAIVAPTGDEAALRDADGRLALLGRHHNAFGDQQWLAADGDGRDIAAARAPAAACDRLACVGDLPEGQALSVVTDRAAFEEDCARASVVVSALTAPGGCKPALLLDERRLAETGAVGLVWDGARLRLAADRAAGEDRPWSPAPPAPPSDEPAPDEP